MFFTEVLSRTAAAIVENFHEDVAAAVAKNYCM